MHMHVCWIQVGCNYSQLTLLNLVPPPESSPACVHTCVNFRVPSSTGNPAYGSTNRDGGGGGGGTNGDGGDGANGDGGGDGGGGGGDGENGRE